MRILRRATMLSLPLAAMLPSLAQAHAALLSSTPAADRTIATLPDTIHLTFDDVLIVVVAALVGLGLAWFLRRRAGA